MKLAVKPVLTIKLAMRFLLVSLACFLVPWVVGLFYPKAMPLLMFWGGIAYWDWYRDLKQKKVAESLTAIVATLRASTRAAAPEKTGS